MNEWINEWTSSVVHLVVCQGKVMVTSSDKLPQTPAQTHYPVLIIRIIIW